MSSPKPARTARTARDRLGKPAPPKLDLKNPIQRPLPDSPWPKRIGLAAAFIGAVLALTWQRGAFGATTAEAPQTLEQNTSYSGYDVK